MSSLYKAITVWRRMNEASAVRFNCLQNIDTKKFSVQSADFFYLPITQPQIEVFERQYLELFIEVSPEERCEWFESLDAAIAGHDRDFSG